MHFHSCEHHIVERPQSNAWNKKSETCDGKRHYLNYNNGMYKTIKLNCSISIVIMLLVKWLDKLRRKSKNKSVITRLATRFLTLHRDSIDGPQFSMSMFEYVIVLWRANFLTRNKTIRIMKKYGKYWILL